MGGSISAFSVESEEKSAYTEALLRKLLAHAPFLANISTNVLNHLVESAEIQSYTEGDDIIREGEAGDGFYIILKGDAFISKKHQSTGERMIFASVRKGDYFGEGALLTNEPRNATITAANDVDVIFVGSHDFKTMFKRIEFSHRKSMTRGNLIQAAKHGHVHTLRRTEKPKRLRNSIIKAMEDNFAFHELYIGAISDIVDHMYPLNVDKNEMVARQGDKPLRMYYIESGKFHTTRKTLGKVETLGDKGPGYIINDVALMSNEDSGYTCKAQSKSKCWVVDHNTLHRLMTHISDAFISECIDILAKLPMFSMLAYEDREYLAESAKVLNFPKNHTIIRQGKSGDCIYVVKEGKVDMLVDDHKVHTLKPGECVGEKSLTGTYKWECTLHTRTKAIVFSFTRNEWEQINANDNAMLKSGSYTHDMVVEVESMKKKAMAAVTVDYDVKYHDLRTVGTVFTSDVGNIQVVRHRESGRLYMMQSISKELAERQLHFHYQIVHGIQAWKNCQHPFIAELHTAILDENRVSFLHDPYLGGDLKSVLNHLTIFSEEQTKFLAAQIVLALQYLHKHHTLYRSLAPESIMLNSNGYIKLVSFEFAKKLRKHARTNSICGFPEFMAPEIIRGGRYSYEADWYALGILIFEFLCGFTPFAGASQDDIFSKACGGVLTIPSSVSNHARDLITKLCHPKPEKRFGKHVSEIKAHPFFKDINWHKLLIKQLKPPYLPQISGDEDLSNFRAQSKVVQIPPYTGKSKVWSELKKIF